MQEQSKFNVIWSGIIFSIMLFILMQLLYLARKPEISKLFLDTYTPMAWFGVILSAILIIFNFLKEPATAHLSPPATSDSYRLVQRTWVKFLIVFILSGVILLSVTTAKIQVLPIPHPFEVGFSISPITEVYLSSVIPGFLEDFMFFWILPQVIFNFVWLLFLLLLKIDLRDNRAGFFAGMLIAIIISSLGSAYLIPGFTVAHDQVYQFNIEAYISAFIFAFIQSLIYMMTGLFFPLAHILHNALFTLGFAVALSIGGVTTSLIFMRIKSWRKKDVE